MGETVQLLFPVFTVRFFYSDFVNIFVLISTKSNFILLRFYGEKKKVLYKWNESTGCFWTNSGYLLRGIVKCWVCLYRWCQRDKWACGWCCCLPLASSGKECQPAAHTDFFAFLWACFFFSCPRELLLAVLFPPSVSEGTDCPLAHPVILNNSVSATISPASLWDKRIAMTFWKLGFH